MSFLLEWVFSESAKRKTNKYVESSAMRGRFVMPYVGVTIGWSIYWNEFFLLQISMHTSTDGRLFNL